MRSFSELLQKPRQIRILIVEDHQLDAEFVIRELKKGGFDPEWKRVYTARDMDAALDARTWDIIISEFKLPQFTGLEALRLLQKKNLDIPFIIFTSAIGEEMAVESMKAGASDCLGKDKIVKLPSAVEHEINKARMRRENARAEARYRTILQVAMDGFWLADTQGRLLEVNETYCRMSGYSVAELLDMRISDLEVVVTGDETNSLIKKIIAKEEDRFESRHRRKDGSVFDVEISVQFRPVEDRLVVFIRDITGRKQAEEALRHEQALVLALMENLPDCIYFKDKSSHFIRVNPAMVKLFRVSDPAQLIGKWDGDFFSAEHAQQAFADEQNIIRTGQPILGIEEKETWPDGHEGWVLTSKLPLRDHAGNIIGTCGISRDITERKREEEELLEDERKWHIILEAVHAGIVIIDPDTHTIVDVNSAAMKLIGETREKLVGTVCHHHICPAEAGKCPITDLKQTVDNSERVLLKADGTSIPIVKTVVSFPLDGHQYLLESFMDISEHRRAEELHPK